MHSKGNNFKKIKRNPSEWKKKCKQSNLQGINLQNIKIFHVAQYIKKKEEEEDEQI